MDSAPMGTAVLTTALDTRNSGGAQVRLQMDRVLLKAHPSVEGGQRVVYMEASTDARDLQGERILLSALESSIPYFLQYGRIDLDHASVTGKIRGQHVNPYAFEIGRPLDAQVKDGSVWVKAAIFSSAERDNRFTEAAEIFWDSLHTSPPVAWYPSVAGEVYSEAPATHEGLPTQEVRGLRWHSVGLSRTPVNQRVAPISTVPFRAFAKAFMDLQTLDFLGLCESVESKVAPASALALQADAGAIRLAVQALRETPSAEGVQGFVARAVSRGVPQEVALALVVVLLST